MDEDELMTSVILSMTDEELSIYTDTLKQIADAIPAIEADIDRKEHGLL